MGSGVVRGQAQCGRTYQSVLRGPVRGVCGVARDSTHEEYCTRLGGRKKKKKKEKANFQLNGQ